jgi:hypothetical protein
MFAPPVPLVLIAARLLQAYSPALEIMPALAMRQSLGYNGENQNKKGEQSHGTA